jgi:hypothetical protein
MLPARVGYVSSLCVILQGQGQVGIRAVSSHPRAGCRSLPWFRAVNSELAEVTLSFFKHGILKQLLTEGERWEEGGRCLVASRIPWIPQGG